MTTPAVTADTITRASDRLREAAALIADAAGLLLGLSDYSMASGLAGMAGDVRRQGRLLADRLPPDLPQRPVHPAQVAQAALDPDAPLIDDPVQLAAAYGIELNPKYLDSPHGSYGTDALPDGGVK